MGKSKDINFDDIKLEYNEFFKQFDCAYIFLHYLIKDIKKFLKNYYKLKNKNEIFADNLELSIAELENIFERMEGIAESINNITLHKSNPPKAQVYNIEDYIEISENF